MYIVAVGHRERFLYTVMIPVCPNAGKRSRSEAATTSAVADRRRVLRPLEALAPAPLEVGVHNPIRVVAPQNRQGQVGALQLDGPGGFPRGDAIVHGQQRGEETVRHGFARGHDHIDVAVSVEMPGGQRPLQVHPDELPPQGGARTAEQVMEQGPQLGMCVAHVSLMVLGPRGRMGTRKKTLFQRGRGNHDPCGGD